MPVLPTDRRQRGSPPQTMIINQGLGLARLHGWSYALAYLIRQHTSQQLIQRLLGSAAQVRPSPACSAASLAKLWPEQEVMCELFQSLALRPRRNNLDPVARSW